MVPCVCVCVCVCICVFLCVRTCVCVCVGGSVYSRVPATVSASQKACRFSRPTIKTLDELISPPMFPFDHSENIRNVRPSYVFRRFQRGRQKTGLCFKFKIYTP